MNAIARYVVGETKKNRDEVTDVELIDAATITPEPISWLWPSWLARGKLHILAGAPGTGKTTIAIYFAACVSAGKPLPSGYRPTRGTVIIWSGEDDPADTLAPRLIAAGADMTRIKFVGTVNRNGEQFPFDPARDIPILAASIAKLPDVAMIVVDPLVSAVAGDSHKNAEVRRALQPLVELAAKRNAALIGITHYSKGTAGRDPLERVTGSVAFGALARIVFGTVRQNDDKDEDQKIIFARAKSNIGPDGGGFLFSLEQVQISEGIDTSRVVWGESVEGTARELLTETGQECEYTQGREAVTWLRELLTRGPMSAKSIKWEANQSGFAWRTVQRAMKAAGAESARDGFGRNAHYIWRLTSACAPRESCVPTFKSGAHGTDDDLDLGMDSLAL